MNLSNQKLLFIGLIISLFFAVNIGYLHYKLYNLSQQSKSTEVTTSPVATPYLQENEKVFTDLTPVYDALDAATSSLTKRIENIENTSNNSTVTVSQTTTSGVAEYYIPLGTGSTNSTEWVDLAGVEAYVAPSNYSKITEMYFEASLRIPTGNGRAYARLINITDNTSLFESEVSREGSSAGLVSSGKIPVPTQTKLYRVQLKSSLGADVKLDNARIKIFVR